MAKSSGDFMGAFVRWCVIGLALLILPGPAQPIFGFKVAGFCAFGCGRDSAVNQLFGHVGAAFSDKAIERFGAEGRAVADYANQKMSDTLDDKIRDMNGLMTEQREGFRQDMSDLAEDATNNLANVLGEGINKLAEEIDVQIVALDATISKQIDRISVLLAIVIGVLVGCVIVLLMGVNMHLRRRPIARGSALIMAGVVLVAGGSGYAVAAAANSRAEGKRHKAFEEHFVTAISEGRLIRAHLLSRKLDALDSNPNNDQLSQKLGLIRETVYNVSVTAGQRQLPALAEYQKEAIKLFGFPDPDIAALQVYIASESPDTLAATSSMLHTALTAASRQPTDRLRLVNLSDDFRILACAVSTELKKRGVVTAAELVSNSSSAFEAGFQTNMGFVLPSVSLQQSTCDLKERVASKTGALVPLLDHVNWRSRQFTLNAAADTLLVQCLLYRICRGPTLDGHPAEDASNPDPPQGDDPVRYIATTDFLHWFKRHGNITGPVAAVGRRPEPGEQCFFSVCDTNDGLTYREADILSFKNLQHKEWDEYLVTATDAMSPSQKRTFKRLQQIRRDAEVRRLFGIFNLFKTHAILDIGFAGHSANQVKAMRQTAAEIRSGNVEAVSLIFTWRLTKQAKYALFKAIETFGNEDGALSLGGHLRLCWGQGQMMAGCDKAGLSVPLFALAENPSGEPQDLIQKGRFYAISNLFEGPI